MKDIEKILIHKLLHSEASVIKFQKIVYEILLSKNNCRYVTINQETFMQQDPTKKNNLAEISKTNIVTRIMRPSKPWGVIINNKVCCIYFNPSIIIRTISN